ncbi:MAG TPA: SAM-dependent methyltransferase [Polyangiaceae bacterium]|nr:SAM-dependent methyltransferase [Polyangiaceae bacterium]
MDGVGLTSLWVAAMRAEETDRPDRLISDPFARALAGPEGFDVMRRGDPPTAFRPPVVVVRTRFYDETIEAALARGLRQLVLVAAGMDARAFRLDFPSGTRVFELDQPAVLSYKAERLGDAKPRTERVAVPVDLREDWPAALRAAGFDAGRPTFWLVEGLTPYLPEADVKGVLARIDALAAPGSEVLFDVAGKSVLESPYMRDRLAFVASLGAPWHFASDEPETLLEPLGWDVRVEDQGVVGHRYGRWPLPVFPRGTPGVPQSFFVHGTKRR